MKAHLRLHTDGSDVVLVEFLTMWVRLRPHNNRRYGQPLPAPRRTRLRSHVVVLLTLWPAPCHSELDVGLELVSESYKNTAVSRGGKVPSG